MEFIYSTNQMIRFIKEYINNNSITWNEILKRHAVRVPISTFMKKIYDIAKNPELIDDNTFIRLREKSILISKLYHPEGTKKIIRKFSKLENLRDNHCKDTNSKTYISLESLTNAYNCILFQLSSDDILDENKLDLEKRLSSLERQIELAKRYG